MLTGTHQRTSNLDQVIAEYRERIRLAPMPRSVRTEALRQLRRLQAAPADGFEHYVIRGYLEAVIELPWPERVEAEQRLLDTLLEPDLPELPEPIGTPRR